VATAKILANIATQFDNSSSESAGFVENGSLGLKRLL
jgi:hypothetical protein